MARITESELVLPTIYLLVEMGDMNTAKLIPRLRSLLKPSGEDLSTLKGRNDDKFSQKVRNLKAHDTLIKSNFVEEVNGGNAFSVTDKGRQLYESRKYDLNALFEFPLDETKKLFTAMCDVKQVVIILSENVFTEGGYSVVKNKVHKRSLKLREVALEHYSKNGKIACKACSFEFNNVYGMEIGKSYIEMHHLTPICSLKGETNFDFDTAMNNIAPLCANCHRVVHLHKPLLTIGKVSQAIGV